MSETELVAVGTGGAWLADFLEGLIGVVSDGTELALIVAFFFSWSAAAGRGGIDAEHAGGGRRVADGGATNAGGGIGRGAVGDVAIFDPGVFGGCLALAFGKVAVEAVGVGWGARIGAADARYVVGCCSVGCWTVE